MSSSLVKICGFGGLVLCATCLSWSEAQASGRRHHCHCQQYVAPTTTAVAPAPAMANTGSTTRYQSAYQSPAPVQTYYSQPRSAQNHGWQEKEFARHIKGL